MEREDEAEIEYNEVSWSALDEGREGVDDSFGWTKRLKEQEDSDSSFRLPFL
jgi:hypothetical protein